MPDDLTITYFVDLQRRNVRVEPRAVIISILLSADSDGIIGAADALEALAADPDVRDVHWHRRRGTDVVEISNPRTPIM